MTLFFPFERAELLYTMYHVIVRGVQRYCTPRTITLT